VFTEAEFFCVVKSVFVQGLLDFFSPPAAGVEPTPSSSFLPSPTPVYPRVEEKPDVQTAVVFKRSLQAKRYRLTLRSDGVAVVTIPGRGSERVAREFFAQQGAWLERAQARQRAKPRAANIWLVGTSVLWRGELTEIRKAVDGERPQVCLAADVFKVARLEGDLRPTLEAHFLRRAKVELTARTWGLAAETGMEVKEVGVRNQRTRWGSCSTGGVISLNWRLIQASDAVRDYVIYHELMHLREMNHSRRFWQRVEEVYPAWREAELWLKRNSSLLGM
jgi:predicted metal-dependent hydrolase